ncbi:tyrosine-protein phosphatase [Listeria goaensis]|uniref:tyrosine-protein phosphatase n=1 Tax=Listeria goaensis TaxID=1649188 RepID=UPI000B58B5AE|nr:tyrosine-protein phosphatase [Listeria goaensis]
MLVIQEEKQYNITFDKKIENGSILYVDTKPEKTKASRQIATLTAVPETIAYTSETKTRPYFILEQPNGEITVSTQRILNFEGTFNFRDLGGYMNENGKQVKWGALYRSGNLAGLTKNDIAQIEQLGIKWICDLRSTTEVTAQQTPEIPNIPNLNIPIGTAKNEPAEKQKLDLPTDSAIYEPLMGESYKVFAMSLGSYREIFEQILTRQTPFLFHCTAGKDRTGVLGALLLKVLDVPEKTIFNDYELTNQYTDEILSEMVDLIKAFTGNDVPLELDAIRPMAEAKPSYLEIAFTEMEKKYGSVEAFIEEGIGINSDMKACLQNMLLY